MTANSWPPAMDGMLRQLMTVRQFPEVGGLMSYGASLSGDAGWRQVGTYVSRILKGAKPADLPVV